MANKPMRQAAPLLELRGKVAGEFVKVRVLEPAQSDARGLYEQIVSGRYTRPFIVDDGETRQLLFGLDFIQSAMRIDDPVALEFAYTRKMMMACLLFVPDPAHVLMIGLGGGSLAKFCLRHLPRARLTVVEVNADVITLRREFEVPEDERLAIVHADAAEFLPATEGDADVVLLDGFDATGIAPAFLDRDFYQAARRRLRPGGVLVANFAGPRGEWKKHWDLLDRVFDKRVLLGQVAGGDNHIALAFADAGYPPDWAWLQERAAALASRYPLDFGVLLDSLRKGSGRRVAALRPRTFSTPN